MPMLDVCIYLLGIMKDWLSGVKPGVVAEWNCNTWCRLRDTCCDSRAFYFSRICQLPSTSTRPGSDRRRRGVIRVVVYGGGQSVHPSDCTVRFFVVNQHRLVYPFA